MANAIVTRPKYLKTKTLTVNGSSLSMNKAEFRQNQFSQLEGVLWQDLCVASPDETYLAMAAWAIEYSSLGFRVYVLDTRRNTFKYTIRIEGYCTTLSWDGEKLMWVSSTGQSGYVSP